MKGQMLYVKRWSHTSLGEEGCDPRPITSLDRWHWTSLDSTVGFLCLLFSFNFKLALENVCAKTLIWFYILFLNQDYSKMPRRTSSPSTSPSGRGSIRTTTQVASRSIPKMTADLTQSMMEKCGQLKQKLFNLLSFDVQPIRRRQSFDGSENTPIRRWSSMLILMFLSYLSILLAVHSYFDNLLCRMYQMHVHPKLMLIILWFTTFIEVHSYTLISIGIVLIVSAIHFIIWRQIITNHGIQLNQMERIVLFSYFIILTGYISMNYVPEHFKKWNHK